MLRSLASAGWAMGILLAAVSGSAWGQITGSGLIAGTLTDPNGGVVPGASVIVKNTDTGTERALTSNEAGIYNAPFLQPGHYEITATKSGFAKVVRSGLTVQVGQNLTIDLSMPLVRTDIIRKILFIPPSMSAIDLLAKMQATRIHLALVIDEYGGTDGLVSMEDLVELIVGDIADEHDERELPAVTRQSDGSFMATGRASLEDIRAVIGNEFDVGEASQEVDTLGGYLVMRAGHVPVRGELVPGPEPFEAEVLDADPRRVKRVKIYRRSERRPPTARETPSPVKPVPARPAAAREELGRPNPNSPRSP